MRSKWKRRWKITNCLKKKHEDIERVTVRRATASSKMRRKKRSD